MLTPPKLFPPLAKPPPRKSHDLAAKLRGLAQTLQPGDRMPSVPELTRQMNVAKTTAEAAVQALVREGLLVRRRGSGTFVAGTPPKPAVPISQTNAVAVLTRHSNSFYDFCLARLNRLAAERGVALHCRYVDDALTPDDVLRYGAQTDLMGFLIIGAPQAWVARTLIESGRRAVVLGDKNAGGDFNEMLSIPSIQADAVAGGRVATQYLLDLGHRRIAFLHRVSSEEMHRWDRWAGHVSALHNAGLDGLPVEIEWETFQGWAKDPQLARAYFSRPNAPTGVVVHNDAYAAHLISVLSGAGVPVPQSVSVIGYDNLPVAETCWPTLTSVDQFLDAQLVQALQFLQTPLLEEAVLQTPMLVPQLVVRRSCAPPRESLLLPGK